MRGRWDMPWRGIAVFGVVVLVLGISACGRKKDIVTEELDKLPKVESPAEQYLERQAKDSRPATYYEPGNQERAKVESDMISDVDAAVKNARANADEVRRKSMQVNNAESERIKEAQVAL